MIKKTAVDRLEMNEYMVTTKRPGYAAQVGLTPKPSFWHHKNASYSVALRNLDYAG